jgi:general secretion pathway protein G
LLELLVVMLIIGILAALGTGGYQLARRSAKDGQAKAEIELLRSAMEEYRVEYGAYPEEGGSSFESMATELSGPEREFLERAISAKLQMIDPWGNPYNYAISNRFIYSVWSDGPDLMTHGDNIDPSRAGY